MTLWPEASTLALLLPGVQPHLWELPMGLCLPFIRNVVHVFRGPCGVPKGHIKLHMTT